MIEGEISDEDKTKVLSFLKRAIDEVLLIDLISYPHNMKFISLPLNVWKKFRRDIVKEVIKHENLNIEINGFCGGGKADGDKLIGIMKRNGLPAIPPEEMERNVDDLLSIDRF